MKKSMKILCAVLALVLTLSCGVGATLAFISHTTKEVENTFVFGNLELKLEESDTIVGADGVAKKNYTIVPGTDLTKDPKVTVSTPEGAANVPCYVFVKVTEQNWPTATEMVDGQSVRKVNYEIAAGWDLHEDLGNGEKVYVRSAVVTPTKAGETFHVLRNDKVTVSANLTKADIDACTGTPTLTFKAYAVQSAGSANAGEAWEKVPADQK